MAWVTVVLAVSALGVLVCSRLTWYETDPLYHLLLWVRDYYFFFCIAVVLLGWVVISWHFISRPVRQLDALIGASAQLTRPDGGAHPPARLHEERGGPAEPGPGARPCVPSGPPGRRSSGKTTWWSIWPTT